MCMILDVNRWGDFLGKKEDMTPIHVWLNKGNGKLLYSNHDKFRELSTKYKRALVQYQNVGWARMVPKDKVEREISNINDKRINLKSNDIHILGLAKASGAKVLCSSDKKLHKNFKDVIGGGIYQTKEHGHLLTEDICP